MRRTASIALPALLALLLALPAAAAQPEAPSTGQTLYVAVYSHVYQGARSKPFNLTCTLSVRNPNVHRPITIESVEYFDSHGERIKDFLKEPLMLPAMSTVDYVIDEHDDSGGSGANFLVRWSSQSPVNPPVVEGVMISTSFGQGISFTSPGRVIDPDY